MKKFSCKRVVICDHEELVPTKLFGKDTCVFSYFPVNKNTFPVTELRYFFTSDQIKTISDSLDRYTLDIKRDIELIYRKRELGPLNYLYKSNVNLIKYNVFSTLRDKRLRILEKKIIVRKLEQKGYKVYVFEKIINKTPIINRIIFSKSLYSYKSIFINIRSFLGVLVLALSPIFLFLIYIILLAKILFENKSDKKNYPNLIALTSSPQGINNIKYRFPNRNLKLYSLLGINSLINSLDVFIRNYTNWQNIYFYKSLKIIVQTFFKRILCIKDILSLNISIYQKFDTINLFQNSFLLLDFTLLLKITEVRESCDFVFDDCLFYRFDVACYVFVLFML